ncbi:MAG TPA: acyl carrier protein [Thermoanaerobaculia bacterium]|nr:acyl carrier protein [Thermoanaerobaculia bacterium]
MAALYTAVAEILQIDSARPQDNFIELGGNSLLAVILANRMEDEFGTRLDVMDIFNLELGQLEPLLGP